jgi:hypothetical protein
MFKKKLCVYYNIFFKMLIKVEIYLLDIFSSKFLICLLIVKLIITL